LICCAQWQGKSLVEHVRIRLFALNQIFYKADKLLVEKCVEVVWHELILQDKRLQVASWNLVTDVADVAFAWYICSALI
jgi:hypothetical protein